MTKSKMIVVWGDEDILSSAIEFFLASKADWKVVNISKKDNVNALIRAVKTSQPDIVILHGGKDDCVANLPLRLLQDHSAIKVITISLENNSMEVYTRQNIWVKQPSDLISVIENEP